MLNLLNGLLAPGGDDWAKLRRTHIATLFQDGNLIPTLSVACNIACSSTTERRCWIAWVLPARRTA